jgi:exopolysaccharide production protein ExoQ
MIVARHPLRQSKEQPTNLLFAMAIFLVVVQQGAFVSAPLILQDVAPGEISGSFIPGLIPNDGFAAGIQGAENPANTFAVGLSLIFVGIASLFWRRQVAVLAANNPAAVFFSLLVVLSAVWSIHPELTIRRGIGYLITMLVAAYLSIRFEGRDKMEILSWSFAISAAGSVLFVAAFPDRGIMQTGDLAGSWRGVFAHKNHFGPVMALAIFCELFILATRGFESAWRFILVGCYLALVFLSRSMTAIASAIFYIFGSFAYLLWERDRKAGLTIVLILVVIGLLSQCVLWLEPEFALSLLGKDPTLTGRTALWVAAVELIKHKPLLGWGYRAVWEPNDEFSARIAMEFDWAPPSSHNAFLEIALQLGLLGAGTLMVIVCVALWRAIRCCSEGIQPLGWFALMFFVGAIVAGQTEASLGQNQLAEWLMFNLLMFSCGLRLKRTSMAASYA